MESISNEQQHHGRPPTVSPAQIDFVASALLELKQGTSVITLSSSSSSASINSNGSSEVPVVTNSSSTEDDVAPTATAVSTSHDDDEHTLHQEIVSKEDAALQPSVSASSDDSTDQPQQELSNVSPKRLYNAKFIHPATTTTTHNLPHKKQSSSKNESNRSSPPTIDQSGGIIQRRFSGMQNINKNMEYNPHMKYHPSNTAVIVVPPVRPYQRPPPPTSAHQRQPSTMRDQSMRDPSFGPTKVHPSIYEPNFARRVSESTTAATITTVSSAGVHSRSFRTSASSSLHNSNGGYDSVGTDQKEVASRHHPHQQQHNLRQSFVEATRPIKERLASHTSNNNNGGGGPLSQIYNEHRKLEYFHPIQHPPPQSHSQRQPPPPVRITKHSHPKTVPPTTSTSTKHHHHQHYTNNPPPPPQPKRTAPTRLPKHIAEYLKRWMDTHIHYPYPSEREKELMMYDTGIDRKRLDVWLRNNRNRYAKVKRKQVLELEEAKKKKGLL